MTATFSLSGGHTPVLSAALAVVHPSIQLLYPFAIDHGPVLTLLTFPMAQRTPLLTTELPTIPACSNSLSIPHVCSHERHEHCTHPHLPVHACRATLPLAIPLRPTAEDEDFAPGLGIVLLPPSAYCTNDPSRLRGTVQARLRCFQVGIKQSWLHMLDRLQTCVRTYARAASAWLMCFQVGAVGDGLWMHRC
jgi:hypothetical protein